MIVEIIKGNNKGRRFRVLKYSKPISAERQALSGESHSYPSLRYAKLQGAGWVLEKWTRKVLSRRAAQRLRAATRAKKKAQVLAAIKGGATRAEVCRKYGVAESTARGWIVEGLTATSVSSSTDQ